MEKRIILSKQASKQASKGLLRDFIATVKFKYCKFRHLSVIIKYCKFRHLSVKIKYCKFKHLSEEISGRCFCCLKNNKYTVEKGG